jgi:hypothetical protein
MLGGLILIIIGLLNFSSCSTKTNQNDTINIEEQTPEVLENEKEIELSSISKRYNEDIIEKLFNEAIDKDQVLKNLVREIGHIDDLKNDSLKDYNKYIQNNKEYWSGVDRYVRQISDSVLKNEITKAFNILEKGYNKKIDTHKKAIGELGQKTKTLDDYELILKLIVSERMIDNYQKNELPNIQAIKGVSNSYDTLINDIKEYIEIKK